MKTDIATSIVAAIAGIIVAYFATNIMIPSIEDVSFKTLESSTSTTLDEPDAEVFNYRAINPTVEVYVGQCLEYNENGECIDDGYSNVEEETEEETEGNEEETEEEASTEGGSKEGD